MLVKWKTKMQEKIVGKPGSTRIFVDRFLLKILRLCGAEYICVCFSGIQFSDFTFSSLFITVHVLISLFIKKY